MDQNSKEHLLSVLKCSGGTHMHMQLLPRTGSTSGGKVIGVGIHIYVCLWTKTFFNRTLAIDSSFQTFEVGLVVEFIN